MTDPIFVSVKEASRILGLSLASTYNLCDKQIIETRYHGRRRLVAFESLRKYAEGLPRYPESALTPSLPRAHPPTRGVEERGGRNEAATRPAQT